MRLYHVDSWEKAEGKFVNELDKCSSRELLLGGGVFNMHTHTGRLSSLDGRKGESIDGHWRGAFKDLPQMEVQDFSL